ncbi:hypothetical protein HUT16_26450 [Kitasatospora sp. NA04385]|uniref:hypothetical protein n=1 Tax=Kitasatospora sp. NA04385 TaxID=2742135 RepID=UPI001590C98E|nr:hypothetical protein [Kitasatospora sp. NA04385]QKW22139.1 hypothetical protein HUT16_26450 [Kitasatospora sp. NA04385]
MTIEQPGGAGDPDYRFNVSSMGPAKRTMERLGMLSSEEPPPWPEFADFEVVSADFVTASRGEESESMRAFHAAGRAVVDWQAEQPTGIPGYKIGGGNDGWLVTPAEIRAALAALEAQPESVKAEAVSQYPRWEEWIDYLQRAATHGGFRVE